MRALGNYLVALRAHKSIAIKEYYRNNLPRNKAIEMCVEVCAMNLVEIESLHKKLNLPKIDIANY